MSKIRFKQPAMVVDLGKFTKGGTSVMRRASDIRLSYSDSGNEGLHGPIGGYIPQNNEERPLGSAIINLNVQQFYVGENDTYGDPVTGNGLMPSYPVSIQATGRDFVKVVFADEEKTQIDLAHPECGKFLIEVANAKVEDAEEGGILDTDYMYDNEFFRQVAYQNYVKVMPLLQQFIYGFAQRGGFDIK